MMKPKLKGLKWKIVKQREWVMYFGQKIIIS